MVLLTCWTLEEAAVEAEADLAVPPIGGSVDLAAVVAFCGLMVSVNTAVVYLAGVGEILTLLLSRSDNCWRRDAANPKGFWYADVEVLRHGDDLRLAAPAQGVEPRFSPSPS